MQTHRGLIIVYFVCMLVVFFSAVLRYRTGEIDYLNSDATWHTLLTIEAYNETPVQ